MQKKNACTTRHTNAKTRTPNITHASTSCWYCTLAPRVLLPPPNLASDPLSRQIGGDKLYIALVRAPQIARPQLHPHTLALLFLLMNHVEVHNWNSYSRYPTFQTHGLEMRPFKHVFQSSQLWNMCLKGRMFETCARELARLKDVFDSSDVWHMCCRRRNSQTHVSDVGHLKQVFSSTTSVSAVRKTYTTWQPAILASLIINLRFLVCHVLLDLGCVFCSRVSAWRSIHHFEQPTMQSGARAAQRCYYTFVPIIHRCCDARDTFTSKGFGLGITGRIYDFQRILCCNWAVLHIWQSCGSCSSRRVCWFKRYRRSLWWLCRLWTTANVEENGMPCEILRCDSVLHFVSALARVSQFKSVYELLNCLRYDRHFCTHANFQEVQNFSSASWLWLLQYDDIACHCSVF